MQTSKSTPAPPKLSPSTVTVDFQENSLQLLIRSFRYLHPYWHITAMCYVMALIITGLAIFVPQVFRWGVDDGISKKDIDLLGGAVLILLGLTVVKGLLVFVQGRWTEYASQSVAYDIRNAIHTKLAGLSFAYHDYAQNGQLLSRSIQDVERIRFLTGRATLRLFEGFTLLIATFIALLLMNPQLAVLSLASMPVLLYVAFRFGRIYRPLSASIQQQVAVLTTTLEQNLRGAQVVKAFAQEEAEVMRFDRENASWFDLSAEAVRTQSTHIPLMDLIASISTVLIVWYGGSLVIDNQLTLGELVAFTTYLGQLVQPVRRLGVIIPALAMAASAGERIFEILDAESDVAEAEDAIALPAITGEVTFENVGFSYFGRKKVLNDISFTAHSGEVIALLGATGSGKSTIINLIPRFYDASEGRITVDGYDIRDLTLNSLRDQIGIVLQQTTLFASTIRENIAFGDQTATEEQVIEAAKSAQAHDFISQMPQGYDTEVGERGITLSGGQKQRVAIARALLKNPRILLLDDATSSVDTETERLIQLALARLMQGRTSFVIAQRLSTVRMADQILVLEKGQIKARGTHDELLNASGLYADIYHRQLRD